MVLPEKFQSRMKEMLGEEYREFASSYEETREYGLRVNTLKLSPEEFEKIAPFPVEKIPWIPNGYYYNEGTSPARHPYYAAGIYYLQEPSAMTPASRLPVEPGDRVLDLCAAPGGKSTSWQPGSAAVACWWPMISALRGPGRCCAIWSCSARPISW